MTTDKPQFDETPGTAEEGGFAADGRDMEQTPWGSYRILADESDHKVKRILVNPGHRLSLQCHRQRAELWCIIQGEAVVVCDGKEMRLRAGQWAHVPQGAWHRVLNPGEGELVFIEIQTGNYFGEDDIERAHDDYGRI